MEERGSYELLWVPKFLELFGQNFRLPPNIVEIYGATLLFRFFDFKRIFPVYMY